MADPQAFETGSIVPKSTEAIASISLDDFKAFFYLHNAKRDTEIRFLKGGKIVELSDIRSLEEQVAAKLGNHETLGQTTSITFTLANKKIKEFSTWAEFERAQWNTVNEKVQALNLSWNVLIQLPQYKSPQTHSMKVRIGNAIPPKDIIQLIFTSDDISEVMEAESPGVCKVDFINNIVANELLFIVDEWYKGLRKAPEPIAVQKFLKKYGKDASQLIRLLFPPLLLFIVCNYTGYIYPTFGIGQELSINALQTVLVFLLTIFMVGAFLGRSIEKSIDRLIDKLEVYPNFLITKGDKNSVEDFERNNKKLTNQIFSRVAWIVFSVPINSGINFLITYFNP